MRLIYFLLIVPFFVTAQQHDNYAVFGVNSSIGREGYQTGQFNFFNNVFHSDTFATPLNFQESVCTMSDSTGNLVFYSNGLQIGDASGALMENGDSISYESMYYPYSLKAGMTYRQTMVAIPSPMAPHEYLLFHHQKDEILELDGVSPNDIGVTQKVLASTINSKTNDGLGKVVEKNLVFREVPPRAGRNHGGIDGLTAIKHGNGRDWWIVMPSDSGGLYYTTLVDPKGFHHHSPQKLYDVWTEVPFRIDFRDDEWNLFSPDGSRFVNFYPPFGLWVLDFDRCTGLFSNPQKVDLQEQQGNPGGFQIGLPGDGAAISPNGRFLYLSSFNQIIQFDLNETTGRNIKRSGKIVAEYDGFQSPWGTQFYLMQLMPDGKIYINCGNSENVMHVINQPDLEGVACDVQQHAIQLPVFNCRSMPYFPNYRLMDLADSLCDTLGINTPVSTQTIAQKEIVQAKVFPNPTSGNIKVEFDQPIQEGYHFILHNAIGQKIYYTQISKGVRQEEITLPKLSSGIYYYGIGVNGNFVFRTGKLVLE